MPQVEKMCVDKGLTDETEILRFLQNGTLVGLLPVPHPILIRRYQVKVFLSEQFHQILIFVLASGQQRHCSLVPDLHVGCGLPEELPAPPVGGDQCQDVHCAENVMEESYVTCHMFIEVINKYNVGWCEQC